VFHHVINVFIFISTATARVLFADPKDVTVEVNEWAQFNCTASCGYSVRWYMAGYRRSIIRNNTVPGLLIKRRGAFWCTGSGVITHTFEVLATEAFNKSAFYCVAYGRRRESYSCGTWGRCYSRPALLTGEPVWNGMIVFLQNSPMTVSNNRHNFTIIFLLLCA